jgi:serine protease AprX
LRVPVPALTGSVALLISTVIGTTAIGTTAIGTTAIGTTAIGTTAIGTTAPPSASATWAASKWGDPATDTTAKDAKGKNTPSRDAGALASVTTAIGARDAWKKKDKHGGGAITGDGVTVALIDSGVDSAVQGLSDPGKVIYGPDLSLEANSADLRGRDTFGHGTHMAGIIAARDTVPTNKKGEPQPADTKVQLGVAPDARLLSMKVAATDGSADVSQVIAALDWVVQHRKDNGMNVRVVNLSYGTLSVQPYQRDPLAAAAENAWKHGITVVVSGGNEGSAAGGLTDPASDPFVLAVGASDPHADVNGWLNPTVSTFSSRGTAGRHVDLVAPGSSIAGLRVRGAFIDANHPEGLVSGDTTGRLFRGSGTSQAAAVTTGAVALLLQAYPNLTPDQVKAALVTTADSMDGVDLDKGAGQLDVGGALAAAKKIAHNAGKGRDESAQVFTESTGLGSLEAARGGTNLVDAETGASLRGEIDVQNQPWNGPDWRTASVAGTAWNGGVWNRSRWTGDAWGGSAWSNARWDGARWNGARWSDIYWNGARWSGARWSGARWSGKDWL